MNEKHSNDLEMLKLAQLSKDFSFNTGKLKILKN